MTEQISPEAVAAAAGAVSDVIESCIRDAEAARTGPMGWSMTLESGDLANAALSAALPHLRTQIERQVRLAVADEIQREARDSEAQFATRGQMRDYHRAGALHAAADIARGEGS